MTLQDQLIGKHPQGKIGNWLKHEDLECTDLRRHRYLEIDSNHYSDAIETVAEWLVRYHLSENRKKMIQKKRNILKEHDFEELVKTLKVFPQNDKTKKGNFGEVILSEYLRETSGIEILIYKLHYNPNIDQSMKGDDVLLVSEDRILLGESKFRSTPSKTAVEEAVEGMKEQLTLPISLPFVAERLIEQGNEELAQILFDFQLGISERKIDIKNVGFLISTEKVRDTVEKNLTAENINLIFISFGVGNPMDFLEETFNIAENILIGGLHET